MLKFLTTSYKNIYWKILPSRWGNKIRDLVNLYRFRERKKSFGRAFPDKTFYIIRRAYCGAGLFSNFHFVLGHIRRALKRGCIPVVDMQNYQTYYNEKEPIHGTLNAWEYYFKQPTEYTLANAYSAKSVILSNMNFPVKEVPAFLYNEQQIAEYHKIIAQYLQFNQQVLLKAQKQGIKLFANRKNILGVKSRGSDYRYAKGHFLTPTSDVLLEKTKQLLKKWQMEYVFLATEETEVANKFQKALGSKLIITDCPRIDNYQQGMSCASSIEFNRENDNYLKGLEYIIEIILLAQCDAFIYPQINGTMAALGLNNNKYKHKYVFDLGLN
jgi:hypothetical protein